MSVVGVRVVVHEDRTYYERGLYPEEIGAVREALALLVAHLAAYPADSPHADPRALAFACGLAELFGVDDEP